MSEHIEISRFSSSGKTFFFNKAEAKNGSPYLAVNALYGRGNQERIVLFEPHMIEFRRHLGKAVEEITGLTVTENEASDVKRCHKCEAGPARHRVLVSKSGEEWVIYCSDCREILYENVSGAYDLIKEERK